MDAISGIMTLPFLLGFATALHGHVFKKTVTVDCTHLEEGFYRQYPGLNINVVCFLNYPIDGCCAR